MSVEGGQSTRTGAVRITPWVFYVFQFGAVTLLIALALGRFFYAKFYGVDAIEQLMRSFDLNREDSVPTWFSMFNLLIASVLLFVVHRNGKSRGEPLVIYWLMLSILFFGMSAEEVIGLHERATRFQSVTGVIVPIIQSNSWLLYGSIFAVLAFLVFLPFLMRLDRRTALLFLLAGGVFLMGAVGAEFIQAATIYYGLATEQELHESALAFIEEGGEMYGIVIFNCTLFARIASQKMSLSVSAGTTAAAPS